MVHAFKKGPIFIGDPMGSWCYGLGKALTTYTQSHPKLPLHILVGGIRAGTMDCLI